MFDHVLDKRNLLDEFKKVGLTGNDIVFIKELFSASKEMMKEVRTIDIWDCHSNATTI